MSVLPAAVRFGPDVEIVKETEDDTVDALNRTFDIVLERTAADYGHAVRAVHAKAHAILSGELSIDADLPSELAQGMFATPGVHKVLMRLSTNAGDILPDAVSLPRGLAIKVLDVDGPRLPGSDGRTQDFIMVNAPVFQAPDAEAFLGNLKLLARTTDRLEGTKKVLSAVLRGVNSALTGVGIHAPAIASLGGAPNSEPLGETYYSATPFRYGDHIAKFSLAPIAPAMTQLTGKVIEIDGRPDAIREDLHSEMRDIDALWEFRVQLCRSLDRQPIEDPTVRWDEEEAPFARVGTIRVAAQDSWDPARVDAVDGGMRFSVWTGLAAHQPLGNINRARKGAYAHSSAFRARTNGCPLHEPAA